MNRQTIVITANAPQTFIPILSSPRVQDCAALPYRQLRIRQSACATEGASRILAGRCNASQASRLRFCHIIKLALICQRWGCSVDPRRRRFLKN